MSSLKNVMKSYDTTTENNAITHSTSGSWCLDFFFKIGGGRGKNLYPLFRKAFLEDPDKAVRILLWARDVRQGAGERQLFRDIWNKICKDNKEVALRVMKKIPEIGRWDDVLSFSSECQWEALDFIAEALYNKDGLCAKWMPREKSSKGILGYVLRKHMRLSSREYRKLLSSLSRTVEQDMSAHKWSEIVYSHVPSQAMRIYNRAFHRHDHERFSSYLDMVMSGEKKMNAGAVHPHEIIGKLISDQMTAVKGYYYVRPKDISKQELRAIEAQWYSLPNHIKKNNSTLCVVDTSGSMSGLPIRVAVALGIYFAERNTGEFKNEFISFSESPEYQELIGDNLQEIVSNLLMTKWGKNTDLVKVFQLILKKAKKYNLKNKDLPKNVIIISDMEFDQVTKNNKKSNFDKIKKEYKKYGYRIPQLIFWNVSSRNMNNIPVKMNEQGVALISGFSPSILSSVMDGSINPMSVMEKTIMKARYDW